ncbi:PaaI family thioesterase [Sedimentimonas flavescens]|uniref:PaaI family thioesterase n=1 Tax=Sedimentimonas flavescens TaxID=2851012 RepID=A0ABT2ZX15_9RHOB|nr:PaaI family thioesterase [Sedimentimonas flavescens]MCV2878283.1 PaaI family thioesterase [Sedimentimonas flavescens]
MQLKMDATSLEAFIAREFPQVAQDFSVDEVGEELVVRMHVHERHLRPGGTVSGPNMFALADVGIYLAILSRLGPVALAVTTGASVDFMRKPEAGRDLVAKVRLLKLGRVLAVGDVLIYSDGQTEPVARASMTYSIPPQAGQGPESATGRR